MFASVSIHYWTVMRFFGSRGLGASPDAWRDPIFSHPLPFYLFDLPFYSDLLGFVFALAILSALVFWATARGWELIEHFRFSHLRGELRTNTIDLRRLLLRGAARRIRSRNRRDFAARICCLDFSGQLRASVCFSPLHDRRRLRGCKSYAPSALDPDRR